MYIYIYIYTYTYEYVNIPRRRRARRWPHPDGTAAAAWLRPLASRAPVRLCSLGSTLFCPTEQLCVDP